MTSDAYFGQVAEADAPFDVIFLDGLHTFNQTLRDLMNSVLLLRRDGVIIVDDVIPNSYHSSLADTMDLLRVRTFLATHDPRLHEDQAWMGDVYKIPFYVRSYMQQFSYATTSENHGQTILWRQPRHAGECPDRAVESIARLEFKDLVRHLDELNLAPTDSIIAAIRQARRAAA